MAGIQKNVAIDRKEQENQETWKDRRMGEERYNMQEKENMEEEKRRVLREK